MDNIYALVTSSKVEFNNAHFVGTDQNFLVVATDSEVIYNKVTIEEVEYTPKGGYIIYPALESKTHLNELTVRNF